ncbi:MAG: hypothetical protein HYU36_03950 [Planctomycetes bacterium]|nr:hypothetical protein [Planctomycetota bacterium]
MTAGMDRRDRARWAASGVQPIEERQGLEMLEKLMQQGEAQVGALRMNWSRLPEAAASSPFLSEIRAAAGPGARPARSDLLQRLEAAPAADRRPMLLAHLREQVAKVLGLKSLEEVPEGQGFAEMGMDSLTSVELRNRIQASLGQSLPPTVAFDYPTVSALAGYLIERAIPVSGETPSGVEGKAAWGRGESVLPAGDIVDRPGPAEGLDGLSEEELAKRFKEKLESLEERGGGR